MKVYVASSWKNILYPGIVAAVKMMGHEVYDFRNPVPGHRGFSWKEVDPTYAGEHVDVTRWKNLLASPIAAEGYSYDITALRLCDVCVLVLPAGRSACFEAGIAQGMGKRLIVLSLGLEPPDLMFREAVICGSLNELFDAFGFAG